MAAAVQFAMAAVVFLTRPDRAQNRYLAAFFFCMGLWGSGYSLSLSVTDAQAAYAFAIAGTAQVFLFQAAYLLFIGTLPTPLVAPLRARAGRAAIIASFLALWLAAILRPRDWQAGVVPGTGTPWQFVPGPAWAAFNTASMALVLFGVAAGVAAYRRARSPAIRRQLRYYVIGFAVYDSVLALLLAYIVLGVPLQGAINYGNWFQWVFSLNTVWLVGWLAYGILAAQLFDIDLRIKGTISRSTVAAAFVAVFFVVTEGAKTLFEGAVGPALGLVAAGLLVFAIAPLHRFADRVGDRAMPHVQDTEEYRVVRKREVYRAAVESALQDGRITDRERDVLATLQEKLGIAATEAVRIEREVAAAARGAA